MTFKLKGGLVIACVGIISSFLMPGKASAASPPTYCYSDANHTCIPTYTVAPCQNNPNDACTVFAAYDLKRSPDGWYIIWGTSLTSAVENAPFYISVNGVYTGVVHTNDSDSEGLAVIVNGVGSNITYSAGPDADTGTEAEGYCNPTVNGNNGYTANTAFGSNHVFTLFSVGYSCDH